MADAPLLRPFLAVGFPAVTDPENADCLAVNLETNPVITDPQAILAGRHPGAFLHRRRPRNAQPPV